ncbi:MAG: hypothetical protein WBA93_19500, partial [Microcoleaceae cyanobacterium]
EITLLVNNNLSPGAWMQWKVQLAREQNFSPWRIHATGHKVMQFIKLACPLHGCATRNFARYTTLYPCDQRIHALNASMQ